MIGYTNNNALFVWLENLIRHLAILHTAGSVLRNKMRDERQLQFYHRVSFGHSANDIKNTGSPGAGHGASPT